MTMTADRQVTGRARSRRGSDLSDRQVAYSVRDGKSVTATLSTGDQISGYVMGSDDFHWAIVDTSGEVHLVHKSSPSLKIDSKSTIAQASVKIRDMVAVFRDSVMRDHFHHTPASSRQKD